MSKTVTLNIRDEVNVRFDGIDAADRRALVKMHSHEVPGARYLPSVRLGRWDGKISYFQLSGTSYVNLLDQIIPFLVEKGYDLELNDVRDYQTNFEFGEVDENSFSHKLWPAGHPAAGQPVVIRDYQMAAVNSFLKNPQSVQVLPTGSGKTLMTAALSYSVEKYGRSIVIVPNKSLVTQTEADYVNLGLDVGVFYGDRKDWGKTHTICTWQSVLALMKNTGSELDITDFLENVVCVICDEVHSAKADALKSMLTGVMAHIPIRWGLTGTIPKDKFASIALDVCIGPVVSGLTAIELQDKGVLSNCHVNIIQLQDNREFKDYQSELKYLLENEKRVQAIAKLINTITESGNTLVLVDRIAAGKALIELIPDSVFVSGSTKGKDRQSEYESVADADGKVIIATYQVAAVGINIPRIFNVVLIEAGRSFVRTIQSIGRGLRKAHDKDHVEIYDLTSSCKFSKRHLAKRREFYKEAQYPFTTTKLDYH
jgi:superfamily II DNA or RNA helicase